MPSTKQKPGVFSNVKVGKLGEKESKTNLKDKARTRTRNRSQAMSRVIENRSY
jgi:hypothetical protein